MNALTPKGVDSTDTPTVRLENQTINAKTTAFEPAFIAIMTIYNGMPFLSVSSAGHRVDVWLELTTIEELHTALGKLLEV